MIKGSGYGKCRDCNVNLFKMGNYTVTYADDYSKPPTLESPTDYVQWSQTKNITLDISDYGAAGVQTSLGDQYSYINAPYVAKNQYRLAYKFKEKERSCIRKLSK